MYSASTLVERLYNLILALPRFRHEIETGRLPLNGLYVFFEKGEIVKLGDKFLDRIVRVGTHREDGRFRGRIRQHYGNSGSLGGNKNGSVFRKHLGGALLRRANPDDHRLRDGLTQDGPSYVTYVTVEAWVSGLLRNNFSFCCFRVDLREERLELEKGIIALLAQCPLSLPSPDWLGRYAANERITTSGLWNTQHVEADPLTLSQFQRLEDLMIATL